MVKPIVSALALSLVLTGCGMFGGEKPAPAPVVQAAPEPAPPPPPPPPPAPLKHTVKKGETVTALSKKYSISASQLMAANNLPNAKALRFGMTLVIPGKTANAPEPKPVAAKAQSQPEAKAVEPKAAKGKKSDPYGVEAATAPEKGKKKPGKVDDEATYEKIKVEFHDYARKWLEKSASLSQTTKARKEVKMEDGRYVASYSVILLDTMGTEVKRVDYDDTPYVGHITYQLEVHRSYGPTAQAASSSAEEEVKQESMREIFSYSGKKRAWR